MQGGIEDLDELILKCRDQKARDYIREAVGSYRAGSYRSAIVATWIAVCFDLIGKFRELALAGDKEAEKRVQELDEINRTSELQRALRFEKDIVELAFKMEMISPIEKVDLSRLQEDRNRCAHPSINSDGERYSPPAELVRLHINCAVNHLLMHEPAQGKFALDRLCAQIGSQYFPGNAKDALKVLENGPLRRARPSLPRNLTIVLIKDLLKGSGDYLQNIRRVHALEAIHSMHNAQYTAAMHEHLPAQIAKLDDSELNLAIQALPKIKDAWQNLDYTQKDRLTRYVRDIPEKDIDELAEALEYSPLKDAALKRVSRITLRELDAAFFFGMHEAIMDRLVYLYLQSGTYETANQASKLLMAYKHDIEAKHVEQIIKSASANSQVMGSYELDSLVKTLRATNKVLLSDFENLLDNNDLGRYSEIPF